MKVRYYNVYDKDWNLLYEKKRSKEVAELTGINTYKVSTYAEVGYCYKESYYFTLEEVVVTERKFNKELSHDYCYAKCKGLWDEWEAVCEPFRNVVWVKYASLGVRKLTYRKGGRK